ncbi:MAG TPA: hypothetical protein VGX23_27075 [Actinocrinis sp.]|nr:hypothetical protein [Actinocrinis sp.]
MGDHRQDPTVREPGRSKIRITALAMAVTGISAAAIGAGAAMTGHPSADGPVQVSIAVAGATDTPGALIPVLTTDPSAAPPPGQSLGTTTAPAGQSPSGTGQPGAPTTGASPVGSNPAPGQSPIATTPAGQPQKPVTPPSPTGKPVNIGGQLTCSSGNSIEGVWVSAATGSGYAPWEGASNNVDKYWYTLPVSEPYSIHVGCGGTPQSWAVACIGPQVTQPADSFECYDVKGAAGYGTCKVK